MTVHFIGASKEFEERLFADPEQNGQSGGAPDGKASAYPIPETELILVGQSESFCRIRVGGNNNDMLFAVGADNTVVEQPLIYGVCVDERLARREAF